MIRLTTGLALAATLALTGCSVSVTGAPTPPATGPAPAGSAPAPAPAASSPAATPEATAFTADQVVPGYAPGQFPPVPLFPIPDTSVLSSAGTQLRDKLQADLPELPGVTITAVQCRPDGSYVTKDRSLSLYGDGSGSYVGPDGTYTSGGDGSETTVTGKESVTRDGKGGGTYVGEDLSVTNAGDGTLSVIDIKTMEITATVTLGAGAADLAVDTSAGVAYVVTGRSVRVYDTVTREVVGNIAIDQELKAIAVDHGTGAVYVVGALDTGEPSAADGASEGKLNVLGPA